MRLCFDHNKHWAAEQMQNKAVAKMLLRSRHSFSHKSHFLFSTSLATNQFWHQAISFWARRQQRADNSGKHNRRQRKCSEFAYIDSKTWNILDPCITECFESSPAADANVVKALWDTEPLEISNLAWQNIEKVLISSRAEMCGEVKEVVGGGGVKTESRHQLMNRRKWAISRL